MYPGASIENLDMSQLERLPPEEENQLIFQASVDGIRQEQKERAQPPAPLPPGYGVMTPAAKYFDLTLVDDDDYYFLGHPGDEAPFWATPRPAYFDAFEAACREDQVATLQQILTQHPLTPVVLHHGLTLALAAGSVASARELLLHGAPLAKRTSEQILSAPQDYQVPLLDLLASHGWTPAHGLFMQSIPHIHLLKWFLAHGIDPNYGVKRDTPTEKGGPSNECADALESAATKGSAEAVELLIEAGAKIAYGVPLHCAAGAAAPDTFPRTIGASQSDEFDRSRIPAMAALVKHGADVNQKENSPHVTPVYPLLYALSVGADQRARWLLDHGADPELKGPYANAVDYAAKMGSAEVKNLFKAWAGTN